MRRGKVLGVEALLRWKHPQHGVIAPAQFLPLIEHTGLSARLGDWVLQQGIEQLAAWLAGDLRDRRRRTEPHWTTGARLRIYTFGGTRVESSEGSIGGRWLEQRPGQLFKYLLAERHRVVRREEIAETIWPGADRRILGSVRHFVHALRTRLEPERANREPSSFILNVQGGYAIDRRHVYIDADDFEDQVRAGLDHLAAGRVMLARERLERALALYTGDFLADEPYADWAMVQRDALRRLAADALRALASIARRAGDLDDAAGHLERLGDLEPFDIELHRRGRAHLLEPGEADRDLVQFLAELDARADAEGIDEATTKELLLNLRERKLRRELQSADLEHTKELQEALERLRSAATNLV